MHVSEYACFIWIQACTWPDMPVEIRWQSPTIVFTAYLSGTATLVYGILQTSWSVHSWEFSCLCLPSHGRHARITDECYYNWLDEAPGGPNSGPHLRHTPRFPLNCLHAQKTQIVIDSAFHSYLRREKEILEAMKSMLLQWWGTQHSLRIPFPSHLSNKWQLLFVWSFQGKTQHSGCCHNTQRKIITSK